MQVSIWEKDSQLLVRRKKHAYTRIPLFFRQLCRLKNEKKDTCKLWKLDLGHSRETFSCEKFELVFSLIFFFQLFPWSFQEPIWPDCDSHDRHSSAALAYCRCRYDAWHQRRWSPLFHHVLRFLVEFDRKPGHFGLQRIWCKNWSPYSPSDYEQPWMWRRWGKTKTKTKRVCFFKYALKKIVSLLLHSSKARQPKRDQPFFSIFFENEKYSISLILKITDCFA